jgi:hypothetical protein
MQKSGFDKARKKLLAISHLSQKAASVNRENGEEILALARVLIPSASGASRLAIKGIQNGNGYLMDFGPLSKILEGGTVERFNKSGRSSGKGPALPFANPALKATKASRKKRIKALIKEALANG